MTQHFKVYDGSYPHFVTSATIHWIPVFRRVDYFHILVDSLNYCIEHRGLLIHAYVIMPDHFHLICSQIEGKLSLVIGNIKGYTAHLIAPKIREDGRISWIRAMEHAGEDKGSIKIWQDEFHPEQIHSRPFFEQKLNYMHDNPVRAGFVENPCHWKYSSAGFYYEDRESVVPITPLEWSR